MEFAILYLPNPPTKTITQTADILWFNSQGRLFNMHIRVMGINTQVKTEPEPVTDLSEKMLMDRNGNPFVVRVKAQAMGFAIPIRRALDVVRPYLQ